MKSILILSFVLTAAVSCASITSSDPKEAQLSEVFGPPWNKGYVNGLVFNDYQKVCVNYYKTNSDMLWTSINNFLAF